MLIYKYVQNFIW